MQETRHVRFDNGLSATRAVAGDDFEDLLPLSRTVQLFLFNLEELLQHVHHVRQFRTVQVKRVPFPEILNQLNNLMLITRDVKTYGEYC